MRLHHGFLEMSIGSNPNRFSEVGGWISVGVGATVLYAVPGSLVFFTMRKREPRLRNGLLLLTQLMYLITLGVWREVSAA
jgi:hypothetical protein